MQIIADTATLYTPEEGKALGVTIIPVFVVIDGKSYKDLEEMSSERFLELVEAGAVPTSSQPAIGDLIELFEKNEEEKLVLTVGDGLSGAYQNAVGARNTMDHGEKIHVLDSKSLAGPQRYLVQKALVLKEKGLDMARIKEELQTSIDSSVSFVIPVDFNFLKRSGRLTPLAAKIGSMIKIVPILTQTEDKKRITPFAIKRSGKKAVLAILDHLKEIGVDENYYITVCHGGAQEKAKEVLKIIKEKFERTTVDLFQLSPSLITHGGPGCIVIQAIRK